MLVLLVEGIYDSAIEMDSSVNTYIPSFIKAGTSIQKLLGWIHRHTDSKVTA
jgi:hypothetical protein